MQTKSSNTIIAHWNPTMIYIYIYIYTINDDSNNDIIDDVVSNYWHEKIQLTKNDEIYSWVLVDG